GLVLHLDGAERRVELLHEVVLLIVQRRPAEARDAAGALDGVPVRVGVLPEPLAGVEHAVRDHLERGVEVDLLPLGRVRLAVQDAGDPARVGDELLARRPLGAEAAAGDGAVVVALDLDDPAVLDVDVLAAADRAGGTHALDHGIGRGGAGGDLEVPAGPGGGAATQEGAAGALTPDRPARRGAATPQAGVLRPEEPRHAPRRRPLQPNAGISPAPVRRDRRTGGVPGRRPA